MFRDAMFPPELSYGSAGGPAFATDVFASPSGWETRRGRYLQNRGRWDLSFENRTGPEISLLLTFFRCVAVGQAYSFRFRDFTDYQFNNQIGWGDGSTRDFPLNKVYRAGAATFTRFLTKPEVSTIHASINGVETTAFAVKGDTGILTFATAPPQDAVVIAWGEFDCMVRFATDTLEITAVDPGPDGLGVFSTRTLELVEVVNEEPEYVGVPDVRVDVELFETWDTDYHYVVVPAGNEPWES